MQALAERVLTKTRKMLLRTQPLFKLFKTLGHTDIVRVENKTKVPLPEGLKAWLLCVGYGDVDETLSFRYDWFHTIEKGQLMGAVIFAQDDLGNFYAYSPNAGIIHFVARSSPEYAAVAPSFSAFMEELERRDFKLGEWMGSFSLLPYDWDA